jgi:mono/diheme cytochrome c family protein
MGRTSIVAVGLVFIVALVACGGGSEGEGGAAAGEELFSEKVLEGQPGCVTCHSRTEGQVLVGPSLAEIGVDADQRVPGMSGREYIEQSIVDPNAYVVDGFKSDLMPQDWGEVLDDAQIAALVDYLLTLQG